MRERRFVAASASNSLMASSNNGMSGGFCISGATPLSIATRIGIRPRCDDDNRQQRIDGREAKVSQPPLLGTFSAKDRVSMHASAAATLCGETRPSSVWSSHHFR